MVDTCTYCGAIDNGTCAYPSEKKPGCVRDTRLLSEQVRQAQLGVATWPEWMQRLAGDLVKK